MAQKVAPMSNLPPLSVSENVPFAPVSPVLPALEQLQMLERLRQLREWQQQQQESLLRQQQEQLARLRSEQDNLRRQRLVVLDPTRDHRTTSGQVVSAPITLQNPVQLIGSEDTELLPHTIHFAPSYGFSDASIEADTPDVPEPHASSGEAKGQVSSSPVAVPSHVLPQGEDNEYNEQTGPDTEIAIGGLEKNGQSDSGVSVNSSPPSSSSNSAMTQEDRSPPIMDESPLYELSPSSSPLASGTNGNDRPIRPGIGAESTANFDQFIEKQLQLHKSNAEDIRPSSSPSLGQRSTPKRAFLRRGQGIARFGMKRFKIKHKGKPQPPKIAVPSKRKFDQQDVMALVFRPPCDTIGTASSEQSTQHGSTGSAAQEQKPTLVRKVARKQQSAEMFSSTESLSQLPLRGSTPTLVRCSSNDSFLLRKEQRIEWEEAELQEFELLEMAAEECSFSSQSSLVMHVLNSDRPTPLTPDLPSSTSPELPNPTSESPLPDDQQAENLESFARSNVKSGSEKDPSWECGGDSLSTDDEEETPVNSPRVSKEYSNETTPVNSPCISRECDSRIDLDDTLKPSPATGIDFNDEEAWESFNHGSPSAQRESKLMPTTPEKPTTRASWASPIKREQLDSWGKPMFSSPLPSAFLHPRSEDAEPVPSLPLNAEHNSKQVFVALKPNTVTMASEAISPTAHKSAAIASQTTGAVPQPENSHPDLPVRPNLARLHVPPPSALVSKLFPALRKEREELKRQTLQQITPTQTEAVIPPTPSESVPAMQVGASKGTISSPVPMNEELRQKLCQLETEIERFRAENATMEKLRTQKEQDLAFLKQEVAEFERQKSEEVARFEEYKREETRKLKKERKIFEAYQREAKAARDRKDKEEIEALRNELQEMQEDFQRRESRWSATLARYQQKVESLEAQNKELQNDLKMMEQERLHWWQQELQQKEISKKNKVTPSPRQQTSLEKEPVRRPTTQATVPMKDRCPNNKASSSTKPSGTRLPNARSSTSSNKSPLPPDGIRLEQQTLEKPLTLPSRSLKPKQSSTVHNVPAQPEKANTDFETQSSSSDEYEIVDVICSDMHGEEESNSGSELSAMAEEIVNEVLGVQSPPLARSSMIPLPAESSKKDGSSHTQPPSQRSQITMGGKSVRFSLDASPLAPSNSEQSADRRKAVEHKATRPPQEIKHPAGKIESVEEDGLRLLVFPNGTRKSISADGKSIVVHFFNGDIKQIKADQTIIYYYADSKTTHTTYPDGLEILEFPNNQSEKHYPNGTKEIVFPDQTVKYIYPNGEEESIFPEGTIQRLYPNGDRTIEFANGQRELHTKQYKRREYPDGTIKTVYPDGRQETHYASGRLRVKDKSGNILTDKIE